MCALCLPAYGAGEFLSTKETDMPATAERAQTNGTRSTSTPPPRPPRHGPRTDNSGYWAAFSLLLGMLVVVVGTVAIWMGFSAHDARKDAKKAAAAAGAGTSMPGMDMSGTGGTATDLTSFAGQGPANAAALAERHVPMSALLRPAPAGPVARVNLVLVDKTLEIAPGVKYRAWAFSGGAPAPFIHVRQGQKVELTLTNKGAIPHSVDFHAARIAPNVAFKDVQPGESIHYTFVANDPGAFMFHCGTKPVLAHIANGMYGAIIVEPRTPLPHADKNYVLVASEWYLSSPGFPQPATLDMAKAQRQEPDWAAWNGYAGQYVTHPLTAQPGETVRFWGCRCRTELRRRLPHRRHDPQPRLGELRHDAVPAQRPDRSGPRRRRRRLRREDRPAGAVSLREPLVRERRPRPGRLAQRRRRQGDDVPLTGAFTFSASVVYVQLALIAAVCEWCLASDAVTTSVTALALVRLRQPAHA